MITNRRMCEEERDILREIHNGTLKKLEDVEIRNTLNPGFMADFSMLSCSGYCGWVGDGTLVLTDKGKAILA